MFQFFTLIIVFLAHCGHFTLIFSLMYNDLIGGVLALTQEQFTRANGWSNLYWGWGVSEQIIST